MKSVTEKPIFQNFGIGPSVHYSHLSAFLFNAFFTIITGIFFNDYLLRIGFNEFHFGVLYSLFYITGFITFPVSFIANSIKRKKLFYLFFHFVSLVFFGIFVIAPYIPNAGPRAVVWISIISMGMFYILSGIGRLVFMPWLYSVVGSEKWTRFFLVRLILSYAVPIVIIAAFGSLLKIDGIRVLSGLFVLALVLAVLATISMMLFPNGKPVSEEDESRDKFGAIFNQMIKHPGFVTILAYCSLLFLGIGLFTPIVYPYLISGLGIDSSTISTFQIVMTITSIGATFYFLKICDRNGSINALVWVSSILWTVPVLLLLTPYSVYAISVMLFALGVADGYGIIFTGTFIALTNFSLQHTPQKNKTVFMAFIEFMKALFLSVGAYFSGFMAKNVGEIEIGPFQLDGYRIVFILSLAFMAAAFVASLRLKYVMHDAKKDPVIVKLDNANTTR